MKLFSSGKRPFLFYGISSGALRAALFAKRHPRAITATSKRVCAYLGGGRELMNWFCAAGHS